MTSSVLLDNSFRIAVSMSLSTRDGARSLCVPVQLGFRQYVGPSQGFGASLRTFGYRAVDQVSFEVWGLYL